PEMRALGPVSSRRSTDALRTKRKAVRLHRRRDRRLHAQARAQRQRSMRRDLPRSAEGGVMAIPELKIVFVDANVLIDLGSSFNSVLHRTLKDLCDTGRIRLVLANHTLNEVTKKFMAEAEERTNQVANKRSIRLMNDILGLKLTRFGPLDLKEK